MKSKYRRVFWGGYLVALLVQMLIQDVLGKEGYLKYAERNWIEIHWGVWVLLIGCALAYIKRVTQQD